jgi:hypothetical protein
MRDKESYTPEEFEKGFEAYLNYQKALDNYALAITQNFEDLEEINSKSFEEMCANPEEVQEEYFKKFSESVEKCKKNIPKSLIDKLKIREGRLDNSSF